MRIKTISGRGYVNLGSEMYEITSAEYLELVYVAPHIKFNEL